MTEKEAFDADLGKDQDGFNPDFGGYQSEGFSKVKISKNSKGINLEVSACGKDYKNLLAIKAEAIKTYKETLRELGEIK